MPSLVQVDTTLRRPDGADLQIVQRETDRSILPSGVPGSVGPGRFTLGGADWLAVRRDLADPEIALILAAPLAGYVQPFERTARVGLVALLLVALFALTLSAVLTTRLTASLERLAVAADAVARGELDHRVDDRGSTEVARVAGAFNTMTESLRKTLGELSQRQALAAVGEYAAALSHEVRNGLTAIRVDLQRAEEAVPDGPKGGTLVARALANVRRLDGIISRSLRRSPGGDDPPRRVDLRQVVRSAGRAAESVFSERDAVLDIGEESRDPIWTRGDPLALEQLFLNLVVNAGQTLSPGGRAIVSVGTEGREAQVIVTNAGTIPPEQLAHVLDPFFSTKAEGTGMGLPIARSIAASHGGSLRIESTPAKGTRVEVRLPLSASD
ncbi:MAG: HAMP domain-containing sensor histidine kinase [Gemmatimonadota bacterium]